MPSARKLRIAMVAPPWLTVPPKGYGGIELVIYHLVQDLINRGHHVTLFSVKGSKTRAKQRYYFDKEQYNVIHRPDSDVLNVALAHSSWAYQEISKDGFDIIHDHTWKEGLVSAMWLDIPVVHTLHGPMDIYNRSFYSTVTGLKNLNFVTISKFQRKGLPSLRYVANVPNAIDVGSFKYRKEKGNYFVYLGRINEEKGVHLACKTAKKLNAPLKIAGPPIDIPYFNKHIKPYLSDKIRYLGEVSDSQKKELLAHAKAFLFPIQWDEPFGLVMIEAMASGTPVVTFNMGSAKEIVKNRQTGYVVNTFSEFVEATKKVDRIDPSKCREHVEKNFSIKVMVDGYERVYEKVTASYARRKNR